MNLTTEQAHERDRAVAILADCLASICRRSGLDVEAADLRDERRALGLVVDCIISAATPNAFPPIPELRERRPVNTWVVNEPDPRD